MHCPNIDRLKIAWIQRGRSVGTSPANLFELLYRQRAFLQTGRGVN